MRFLSCALIGALFTLTGCSAINLQNQAAAQPEIAQQTLSERYQQQAQQLPGRIYDGKQWISEEQALERLQSAERIILGERHDNPDHHALQQQLVTKLADAGWLQQLSLEMLHSGFQADLDQLDASQVEQLEERLQWSERNPRWPWNFYGPIIQTALSADAAIQSANLERSAIMELYQNPGAIELPDPAMREPIAEPMIAAHCGQLEGSRLEGMLAIQSARDTEMAKALAPKGSLLLAGAFHARLDVGAPRYLKQPGLVSVGFIELSEGLELEQVLAQEAPRYDLLWITPAMERPDHCAQMQKMKKPRS